ncbi:MAG: glycosyltransferase [Tepidisphaerales bacterium]
MLRFRQPPDASMLAQPPQPTPGWKRADLHCHSSASNRAAEAALRAIRCPESYSPPLEVYAQARRRGMDFVTITDHDSIDGVLQIAHLPGVLVGEEVTCYFPEDGCKLHVLVYGITEKQHDELQSRARDVYQLAEYLERHRIAHSVAHPIYRQNDMLELRHIERMLLLFKGFECLNGSHSSLHREAFEPLLDALDKAEIARLSLKHDLLPRWPESWVKSRTAGSDDHGLLNVGRTWTEFPPDVTTVEQALDCLRNGRTRANGEAGSSAKLAHAFYSVAVRYYTQRFLVDGRKPNLPATLLQLLVGQRPKPTRWELLRLGLTHKARSWGRRLVSPLRGLGAGSSWGGGGRGSGNSAGLIRRLFVESARRRAGDHPALAAALDAGLPPLGEHDEVFRFASAINRDVTDGIVRSIRQSLDEASFTKLFDSISAILAHQFVLLPYYFAVFHQNKERHLLRRLTGQRQGKVDQPLKVALFTDTFDEVNGVARFIRDMGSEAQRLGRGLTVVTCNSEPRQLFPWRQNFDPLMSTPMPFYPGLSLNLPPVLEVLEWADRQQFDAVHCSTPGPMGLVGWLVSKMLRVPMLATYHTDFPAYLRDLSRDHRMETGTAAYMRWFYGQAARTLTRSRVYVPRLQELGIPADRIAGIVPATNVAKFTPDHRDPGIWQRLGITPSRRVLYVGRVSEEKNLRLLASSWKWVAGRVPDAALVVVGDGPFLAEMKQLLAGTPAYFLGYQPDAQLGPLYASADFFVFPSRTDTLGQVVMEAMASGLPAIVSDTGGPSELVEDGHTGLVLPAAADADVNTWAEAIVRLLEDTPLRQRLARNVLDERGRFTLTHSFESFWSVHERAAAGPLTAEEREAPVGSLFAPQRF